ncbi:PREDICTED: centrosomal protein of 152 kDa [Gekko japonicus]|uniref:Centrosomal protein of 152 kDa n=1 Tax=Gekko japonicus TaxID=146911 RepID=A0ABM1K0N0_GEKJA|nr:PREDICTED: centrosomal protein of 152 kDa [Gekko japonicus]
MSLDFDSAALQMQHDEEEYDQEDYMREQELQKLLTDLPHDMLEDSDHLSNFSDCSTPKEHEQVHGPWDQEARWNDHPIAANPQSGLNLYAEHFLYDHGNIQGEMHASEWPDHHSVDEERNMYEISGRASDDGSDDVYLGGDGYQAPNHYPQDNTYHLPENFKPSYTNGHQQDFSNQHKTANLVDTKKEHMKTTNSQSVEPYKVIYKPCQNNIQKPVAISPDTSRRIEAFEDLQHEFLGTGENASDNVQILQLQVLNKAKGRQLEEFNKQLEERAQQIRYLSHQLSIVKDEKDGMCLSLQESQKLYQSGKEREVQLEGQIKALEAQIQTLVANEEKLIKQTKVAETAMESTQQQLMELRRSEALQRTREQHEAIVTALKQKYEEQVVSLQEKLDARCSELQEQTELCCHLRAHMKQLERTLEESKLEKNAIINQLSRSLEESQNQCANLLQTGLVQETHQLRLQLQQAQSSQLISNEMNKALQEELKELKEELVLYESAAKHGVYISDPGGKLNVDMTDSYVDLGIKKVNKKTRLHSDAQNKEMDKELCKDEIILELKAEMERLLSSNKAKRYRVSQLQNNLKECQRTIEELKQLAKGRNIESPSGVLQSNISASENNLKEDLLRLQKENQVLQQAVEELEENEEKLKKINQDLCSQMRQIVQDFDRDKQETIDRYERTYRQHYEDMKKKYCEEFTEEHAAEKEKLIRAYDESIAQLKAEIDEVNKEMMTVKECYITVCREKDEQEAALRGMFEREQQLKEENFKKQLLEEKEKSLNGLRAELEETHKNSVLTAKAQWQEEKEADMKQCVENEVERAKACWEREHKETIDQAIREVEKEWQHRLDQALEEGKKTVVERKDCCCQTQLVTITDEMLSQLLAKEVEKQTPTLQEALKEKEKSLREHEANLEMRHRENIAHQVELALTKARARWLQELTELEEYKTHLKAAQEKWEKDYEVNTAKQVSLAVSAAEEKWKKELESSDQTRVRTKDLEEKILSLKRELELKKEEIPAIVKAEVAKARTLWNKEKQEEILAIQEQNEKDYHAFLHDHRNKINELLAKAKEDFAKQKEELLEQKEADLKVCLERKQQEWAVQEAKRFQNEVCQYEDRALIQVELLLDEMHKDFVRCAGDMPAWQAEWQTAPHIQSNLRFKDRLMLCLQKVYTNAVSSVLEKAKQKGNKTLEDSDCDFKGPEQSVLQSGEGERESKAWPATCDVGEQAELQRRLRKPPSLQEAEMDNDSKSLLPQEDFCCKRCLQQLERKERECQDLRRKLDKACRHLQLTVKEHRAKAEQWQENEKMVQTLTEENVSMKNRLEDMKPGSVQPRSLSEGCVSKPCTSCDGKALEEMRSQYIKAVGKIKSDMLRYIHESKERAADIIKAEVLRERQETARKMRKYYLICLQQLLIDDGKNEGAEKKIICAASKLATMAQILETPVRNSPQSTAARSALSCNSKPFPGAEDPKGNHVQQPKQGPAEVQAGGRSIAQKANHHVGQKRIPCSLREQLDAESPPPLPSNTLASGKTFKQLDNVLVGAVTSAAASHRDRNADKGLSHTVDAPAFQNRSPRISQTKFQNMNPASCSDGRSDSRGAQVMPQNQNERRVLKEVGCLQSTRYQKPVPRKANGFDVQETPVKDDGSSANCSLVTEPLHLESMSFYPAQKAHPSTQVEFCQQFRTANQFSQGQEGAAGFYQQASSQRDKVLGTTDQALNCSEGHRKVNLSHVPCQNPGKLSPRAQQSDAMSCLNAGRSYNLLHSRKQIHDVKDFQQDSGFDSPQINFD